MWPTFCWNKGSKEAGTCLFHTTGKKHCWCAFFRPTKIWQGQNQWGKQQCVEIIPRQNDKKNTGVTNHSGGVRCQPSSVFNYSLLASPFSKFSVQYHRKTKHIVILSWLLGEKNKPIPEPGKNERKWLSVEITGNKAPVHIGDLLFSVFPMDPWYSSILPTFTIGASRPLKPNSLLKLKETPTKTGSFRVQAIQRIVENRLSATNFSQMYPPCN